ncbi:uncharacterized protein LOC143149713 [Ptiloglossa arizonensis]|uniref:uncharacterized protein LOC143149713 n=1 Tax=Ptiloglossa arizonensis TaxID=3350558 RepID=UPI003F9F505D
MTKRESSITDNTSMSERPSTLEDKSATENKTVSEFRQEIIAPMKLKLSLPCTVESQPPPVRARSCSPVLDRNRPIKNTVRPLCSKEQRDTNSDITAGSKNT